MFNPYTAMKGLKLIDGRDILGSGWVNFKSHDRTHAAGQLKTGDEYSHNQISISYFMIEGRYSMISQTLTNG